MLLCPCPSPSPRFRLIEIDSKINNQTIKPDEERASRQWLTPAGLSLTPELLERRMGKSPPSHDMAQLSSRVHRSSQSCRALCLSEF